MKAISRILIFSMLHLCWLTSYGWAEMINTPALQPDSQARISRQLLLDLLHRREVVRELTRQGITREEAAARINSLTDEELAALINQANRLPAGGNDHTGTSDTVVVLTLIPLIILGIVLLIGLVKMIFFSKDRSASHEKGSAPSPSAIECDPGMEACP